MIPKKLPDYEEIANRLQEIKISLKDSLDRYVFFQYLMTPDMLGGVKITLEESWSIIQQITAPSLDIIATDENFTFGFCVEVDEHDYFLFAWDK